MRRLLDAENRSAFSGAVLAMLIAPCACSGGQGACSEKPEALVLVDQAQTVTCGPTADGGFEVAYEVREPYPADKTLKSIQSSLSRLGWQALEEDLLNPGVSSSHVGGWASFKDATTNPTTRARQWYAQWRNASGDVVAYGLLYASPLDQKETPDTVTVSGRYLKCETIVEGLRKLAPESPHITECGTGTPP